MYAEVAKIYKDKSSTHEIVKRKKGIRDSFAVAPQTAKVMTTVCGKCLVRIEKALNLWVEDTDRKCFTRAYVKTSARGPVKGVIIFR